MPHSLPASFLVAFTFLTRFGVAPCLDTATLAHSVRWYGAVGALLGVMATLPLYALTEMQVWHGGSLLTAWLYVALLAWYTRGLHWDGLADLGDALGSGARGVHFWRIMHDSTLGAFGAMTMLFTALGLTLAGEARIAHGQWQVLALAPVAGRCGAVLLAGLCPPRDPESLGGKVCGGATTGVMLCHAGLLLAALGLARGGVGLPLLGSGAALWYMCRIARREGGINGDMLGAIILMWEVIFLLTV